MSTTQELLGMIATLRQRLEQAQAYGQTSEELNHQMESSVGRLTQLRRRLAQGRIQSETVQQTFRQGMPSQSNDGALYSQARLTNRARGILRHLQQLLEELRSFDEATNSTDINSHPAHFYYQDTILLLDMGIRNVLSLPNSPNTQMRQCSALDVLASTIEQRISMLATLRQNILQARLRINKLAELLQLLASERLRESEPFFAIAEEIWQAAQSAPDTPLLFDTDENEDQYIATLSINVGNVIAKSGCHLRDWHDEILPAIVAGLMHDVGMLQIPSELYLGANLSTEKTMAEVERHCHIGGYLISGLRGVQSWMVESARYHHERLDGTGYPYALTGEQQNPLIRFVAAADYYVGLRTDLKNQPAMDAHLAMRELQRLADRGSLDNQLVATIASLGYYPNSTAVELSNGSSGIVVSTAKADPNNNDALRPVVAVLQEHDGICYPYPRIMDLRQCHGIAVTRSLTAKERKNRFGDFFPQWAAL